MEILTGFNETVLKNLQDKSIEKRKQAASDIQQVIEQLMLKKNENDIREKIRAFKMLTEDENLQKRRSGLYGLSVISVALYQQKSIQHQSLLIQPVITCFTDKEFKVQLAACDAMFNIIKVFKEGIVRTKEFFKIFDGIIEMVCDLNGEVREWAKKVDDLLKDVVYGCLIKNNQYLSLDDLLNRICQKLRDANNNEVLMVVIKWIEILHSITNVDILKWVP